MEIKEGSKVIYRGASKDQATFFSACTDPRPILIVGAIYTVTRVDVHSWHTRLILEDVDGEFNSVCFDVVE